MTKRTPRPATTLLSALAVAAALVGSAGAAGPASATPGAGERQGVDASYQHGTPTWSDRMTGTTQRFRGLAPVSRDFAWVSGTRGTVLRTTDGGRTWDDVSPGVVDGFDTSTLQFRDIEAWDGERAVILSIGEGADSRIYRTEDGGQTWRTTFVNAEPTAFYDCIGFFDARHGLAMSDPVDGRIRLQTTSDGGSTWSTVDPAGMPAALPGEFGFAASGTCLVTSGGRDAWVATGGGERARVFHTQDRGRTWTVADTPVRSTPAGGIFSLAFRDPRHGVAVGGDYLAPESGQDASAWSRDGGRTWTASQGGVGGYRSGSDWLPRSAGGVLAVGPTGSDLSRDGGRTWTAFDSRSLDSVECTQDGACWASGATGRVSVLDRS